MKGVLGAMLALSVSNSARAVCPPLAGEYLGSSPHVFAVNGDRHVYTIYESNWDQAANELTYRFEIYRPADVASCDPAKKTLLDLVFDTDPARSDLVALEVREAAGPCRGQLLIREQNESTGALEVVLLGPTLQPVAMGISRFTSVAKTYVSPDPGFDAISWGFAMMVDAHVLTQLYPPKYVNGVIASAAGPNVAEAGYEEAMSQDHDRMFVDFEWRADLNQLGDTDIANVYVAIEEWIDDVPGQANSQVPRQHWTVDHTRATCAPGVNLQGGLTNGTLLQGGFLNAHRFYMQSGDAAFSSLSATLAGVQVPYRRLPVWDPRTPLPLGDWQDDTTFNTADPVVGVGDFAAHDWDRGEICDGYAPTNSGVGLGSVMEEEWNFFTDFSPWHNNVHVTLSGFLNNNPAFAGSVPTFFVWHSFVDSVWKNHQECGYDMVMDAATAADKRTGSGAQVCDAFFGATTEPFVP